jgi:hypothetical protein
MSVWPAGVWAPGVGGPPSVTSSISVKLLKLKAKAPMSNGANATSRSGNVIRRKRWNELAPSISAAS